MEKQPEKQPTNPSDPEYLTKGFGWWWHEIGKIAIQDIEVVEDEA